MSFLSPQQVEFFETFGFLKLPALIRNQIEDITADFESVFQSHQVEHDGVRRSCLVPFADQHPKLIALLEHPSLHAVASELLGPDFNYASSDGNYYTGDTTWHSDGFHAVGRFIKFAFYLDAVDGSCGALRVIPGSHAIAAREHWLHHVGFLQSLGALAPATVLDSAPGDVLVFNHNLWHASFGGGNKRRMFTLNLSRRAMSPEEIADLRDYISGMARFHVDEFYAPAMLQTAPAGRMVHLEQILANQDHLPALAARARLEMIEPSRG